MLAKIALITASVLAAVTGVTSTPLAIKRSNDLGSSNVPLTPRENILPSLLQFPALPNPLTTGVASRP